MYRFFILLLISTQVLGQTPSLQRDVISKSSQNATYANQSVLNSGTWFKMKILQNGIYKLTYDDLKNLGFTNPQSVRIFGYGGRMLPLNNADFTYDDLPEKKIYIENNAVYFYAQASTQWSYDAINSMFVQTQNLFSDGAYYFITCNVNTGYNNQILLTSQNNLTPNKTINYIDDYQALEKDSINLIQSGRQWFWKNFNLDTTFTFNFVFNDVVSNSTIKLRSIMAASSTVTSNYTITANNFNQSWNISPVTGDNVSAYAYSDTRYINFNAPTNDTIPVIIIYHKTTASSEAWLDNLTMNVTRQLNYRNQQFQFRSLQSVGDGSISQYNLQNANSSTKIWDVTDPINCKSIITTLNKSLLSFAATTDSLREFIVFDTTNCYKPVVTGIDVGFIQNQNLHSIQHNDFIIVANSKFIQNANQLADIHRTNDGLKVVVVTQDQIFNEFSSGTPDVSAIRNFVRMIYNRPSATDTLKYLLLFGDGSYDTKSQPPVKSNYILTFQSDNSLNPTTSYVSDDFFGMLDYNEGGTGSMLATGTLDVGVGRFPVQTEEQSAILVNKIKQYYQSSVKNNWRNRLCFVADDEDYNLHLNNAEGLVAAVNNWYPDFAVNKIYLDSYKQSNTLMGQRYPDVNIAIDKAFNDGYEVINYTGHGDDVAWASERVLTFSNILSISNPTTMPVVVTATCEFSRFDGDTNSGGEELLLHTSGAVGLLSTTRLAFSSPNYTLNKNFFKFVFANDYRGRPNRLGEIMRLTKNASGANNNKLNFTLLGDPAINLNYPKNKIITDSIFNLNSQQKLNPYDTVNSFANLKVYGHIETQYGIRIPDFAGQLNVSIFDKASTITTLGNDGQPTTTFRLQNSVLQKGNATITNGQFKVTVKLPRFLDQMPDTGMFLYYAYNANTDARGVYSKITFGGYGQSNNCDNAGPQINLAVNKIDTFFVLTANLSDSSGINGSGYGFGREIMLTIDSIKPSTDLSDYFNFQTGSTTIGLVNYYLPSLPEGHHLVTLKAWDLCNNSSAQNVEFDIIRNNPLALEKIYNSPNPLTTQTSFYFVHNQLSKMLNVQIDIFTFAGKIIRTISTQNNLYGYISQPIIWNRDDNNGTKIKNGIYLYRIKISNDLGVSKEKFEKLIIED